jgi:hypothetical protein
MKRGYVCVGFQPISVIMNDSNQLNKFWISCSNMKKKRDAKLPRQSKMTYFHLECQNIIKIIKQCPFFAPMSPIFLSKPLECIFLINKINLIVLINTFVSWKNPRF